MLIPDTIQVEPLKVGLAKIGLLFFQCLKDESAVQFKLMAFQELSLLLSPLNNAVENMMKLGGKNYIRYEPMSTDINAIQRIITTLEIAYKPDEL